MWDYHGLPYEMKQSCAKRKISNHGIKTDYPYKRMYSCAERRLVKKYLDELKLHHQFILLSQKEPCFACKRVISKKKIIYKFFEKYSDPNEVKHIKDFDQFAIYLDSLKP